MNTTDDSAFDRLLTYIEDEYGFATSQYEDKYLDRRLTSRMRRNDVSTDDYDQYRELLEADDGEERRALLDTLSVNVTSFFRDPDVWAELRSVLSALDDAHRHRISVWNVPCSDGREPYSLGMLAHDEPTVDARKLSIRGSDIDPEALERAREGVYRRRNTDDLEAELEFLDDASPYVGIEDEYYTVDPTIREMVEFDRFDLIEDSPESTFDLVMCRNFLIYVDDRYKRPVLEKLLSTLDDGGYLVVGKTETIPYEMKKRLEPVDNKLRIYRQT
jgi:chemotaxis protein methyltransferase CheR